MKAKQLIESGLRRQRLIDLIDANMDKIWDGPPHLDAFDELAKALGKRDLVSWIHSTLPDNYGELLALLVNGMDDDDFNFAEQLLYKRFGQANNLVKMRLSDEP